jgi:hypothetical protein
MLLEPQKVTESFTTHTTDQCRCCLQLGHHHATCANNSGPICGFCARDYPTDKHHCPQCPSHQGKSCTHTAYRYSNCTLAGHIDTTHAAVNPRYPIKNKIIRGAWQKTRATTETDVTTDDNDSMNTHQSIQPTSRNHKNHLPQCKPKHYSHQRPAEQCRRHCQYHTNTRS